MQLRKVPLPPPFEPGALFVKVPWKPGGIPVTKGIYDQIMLFVETLNAGIDEVGGADWREVLGRAAEERQRRQRRGHRRRPWQQQQQGQPQQVQQGQPQQGQQQQQHVQQQGSQSNSGGGGG